VCRALCRAPYPTPAESLARIRRHAENDVPEAIRALGDAYCSPAVTRFPFVVKSTKKAAKIYKRAVELGEVNAMVTLAWLYQNGDGVKLDMKKATELYRRAADRGQAQAQFELGKIIDDPDAEEGSDEAFRLFKLSAEQGYTAAEFMVGVCYGAGRGVGEDRGEADRWLSRAAAKGHERAAQGLTYLRNGAIY